MHLKRPYPGVAERGFDTGHSYGIWTTFFRCSKKDDAQHVLIKEHA